jgi:hypothetical protein
MTKFTFLSFVITFNSDKSFEFCFPPVTLIHKFLFLFRFLISSYYESNQSSDAAITMHCYFKAPDF